MTSGRTMGVVVAPTDDGLPRIAVHGIVMLLTDTVGGTAVHLTDIVTSGALSRLAVVRPSRRESTSALAISASARASIWSPRTLCGRVWQHPARPYEDTDGSVVQPEAPTCRRCLAIVDRLLPVTDPDDRVAALAKIAAQSVHDHGTAEIIGVPGDQLSIIRTAIRNELRNKYRYRARTYVIADCLLITSNDAAERLHDTASTAIRSLDLMTEPARVAPPDWRFFWNRADAQ